MLLFVSRLQGQPVLGAGGARLAEVRDLIVNLEGADVYPPVRGLLVEAGRQVLFVPVAEVAEVGPDGVRLRGDDLRGGAFARQPGEALVDEDLLDHQLVDVQAVRIIRANDAAVNDVEGQWRLVGIDASSKGMLRRLGPRQLVGGIEGDLVDWAVLEPLATAMPAAQLTLPHHKLAQLHPSDIARVVDQLPHPQASEIMAALDNETAADTIEEMEEGRQADILEDMPEERAADILDEMDPDAAADVLEDMPREKADELIAQMDPEEAGPVQLLLTYPEDSAGGMMTTDFIFAQPGDTTRQVVESIRGQLDRPDLLSYVYVVDHPEQRRLVGVVPLALLLLAEPDAPVSTYMESGPRHVQPDERATEAARLMAEYNLLALPVVDEDGHMLGLVTADDALDMLLPEPLKRHGPRVFG